jgi:predicted AAA+ superfamily ATPase
MKWIYKPRWVADQLLRAVEFSPVVVLTGARQTGKSTLLREEAPFKDWPYYTLDDFDVLELAEKNPTELVTIDDRMIIDEVQKVPNLLSAIKKQVDLNRQKRFILSGSAHLLLMKNVAESLAGRCLYFELLPFALGEVQQRKVPAWLEALDPHLTESHKAKVASIPKFQMQRGFLPPVTFLDSVSHITDWWQGYTRTYLERDLRDLSQIANLPDFRKVMNLLASQSAHILNQANIARAAGISQATMNRYVNLLEISGLFKKLQPYSVNIKKRIVKSPKIYCIDTGLICSLTGTKDLDSANASFYGQIFETFVFHNLSAIAAASNGQLFYLRKQGGLEREIDFLLEKDNRLVAIEVKAARNVSLRDAENMLQLKENLEKWTCGVVIYNGTEMTKLRKDIYAIPCGLL